MQRTKQRLAGEVCLTYIIKMGERKAGNKVMKGWDKEMLCDEGSLVFEGSMDIGNERNFFFFAFTGFAFSHSTTLRLNPLQRVIDMDSQWSLEEKGSFW